MQNVGDVVHLYSLEHERRCKTACHVHVPVLRAAGTNTREMTDQMLSSRGAMCVFHTVGHLCSLMIRRWLLQTPVHSGIKTILYCLQLQTCNEERNCLPASEMSCVPSLHQRDIQGPAGCKKNKK